MLILSYISKENRDHYLKFEIPKLITKMKNGNFCNIQHLKKLIYLGKMYLVVHELFFLIKNCLYSLFCIYCHILFFRRLDSQKITNLHLHFQCLAALRK